jgi:hypothetical protein
MHNTALHNAWGVTAGYDFSLSPESDENLAENIWLADQVLTVQPGIAYDCFGRELILPQAVVYARESVIVTEAASRWVLLASYQESGASHNETLCKGSPNSTAVPLPHLQWRPENEANYGVEVPLLLASLDESGELVVSRYAASRLHPQARPKMASGKTVPGLTAWRIGETILISSSPEEEITILEVDIDTRDAGFQQTPCYFAWLNGRLTALIESIRQPVAAFEHLANEQPGSFTFRFLTTTLDPAGTNKNELVVCWLAIESQEVDLSPADESEVVEPEPEPIPIESPLIVGRLFPI